MIFTEYVSYTQWAVIIQITIKTFAFGLIKAPQMSKILFITFFPLFFKLELYALNTIL